MSNTYKRRRLVIVFLSLAFFAYLIVVNTPNITTDKKIKPPEVSRNNSSSAKIGLNKLEIKGRAPKTGYSRAQFGAGWQTVSGCDTRNIILNRDLTNVIIDDKCNVTKGVLNDPYTGKTIQFTRGSATSSEVQIDHVVALSDAWQKGAQQLSFETCKQLANDPLELLAVSGSANQQKLDGDAATWLPSNKPFRCQYVARQIAIKLKYHLWVTRAEHDAISKILNNCQNQQLPISE